VLCISRLILYNLLNLLIKVFHVVGETAMFGSAFMMNKKCLHLKK